MTLALLGFGTVFTFIALIMTRRLSAVVALVAIPILFGLIAGAGTGLGEMMLKGVADVTPVAVMLSFAVLYFAVMMDAGLFAPLVRRTIRMVGNDPMRVSIGTAALASLVSVDGDGTTTALIVITTMLPIYHAIRMNPMILATLLALTNAVMNFVPWGGPSARAAAALKVDLVQDIFLPMLPAMILTLIGIFVLAWHLGRLERRRLNWSPDAPPLADTGHDDAAPPERRPRLIWFNLALTIALMVSMMTGIAPPPALMMIGFVIALTVNYPSLKEQRARMEQHAFNVVMVVALMFAAGSFTGIVAGTGMLDAMAASLLHVVPPAMGPYLASLTALLSMPMTFLMSNDAYYFGIVPVVAQTASSFGIPPEVIARASLVGQPVHSFSPLLAAVYLASGLLGLEVGDVQRFALRYAVLTSLFLLAMLLLTGALPLRV